MGQVYNVDSLDTFMVEDSINESRVIMFTHIDHGSTTSTFEGADYRSFTDKIRSNVTTTFSSGVSITPGSVAGTLATTRAVSGGSSGTTEGPSGTTTTTSTQTANLDETHTTSVVYSFLTIRDTHFSSATTSLDGTSYSTATGSYTAGESHVSYDLTNDTSATFAGPASGVPGTIAVTTAALTNISGKTWSKSTDGAVYTGTAATHYLANNTRTVTTTRFTEKTVVSDNVTGIKYSTVTATWAPIDHAFFVSRVLVATSHIMDSGLAVYTANNTASITAQAATPAPFALAAALPITGFGVASSNGAKWGNYGSYTEAVQQFVVDNDPEISDADMVSHIVSNGTIWSFSYDNDPNGGPRNTALSSSAFDTDGTGLVYYYPSGFAVSYKPVTTVIGTTVLATMVSGASASSSFTNSTFAGSSYINATVTGQSVREVLLVGQSENITSTDSYTTAFGDQAIVLKQTTYQSASALVNDLTRHVTVRGGMAAISSQSPQVIARGPSRGFVKFNLSHLSDLRLFTGSGMAGQTFDSALSAYGTATATHSLVAPCTAMVGGYGRTLIDHGCGCTTASWTATDATLTCQVPTTATNGTTSTASSFLSNSGGVFTAMTTSAQIYLTATTTTTAPATYGISASRKWAASVASETADSSRAFNFTVANDRFETIKGTRTITLQGSVATSDHFFVRLDDPQTAPDMMQFYAAPFDQATLTWANLQLSLTIQGSTGSSTLTTKHAASSNVGSLDVAGKNIAISCGQLYLPSDGGEVSKQLYYHDGVSPINKSVVSTSTTA